MNANPKIKYVRSVRYRKFVASLPCCVCGRADVQCAHVKFIGEGRGTGIKVSDEFTVPLCVEHHRQQGECKLGERGWWEMQDKDPGHIAETLYLAWQKWKNSPGVLRTYSHNYLGQP